MDQDDDMRDLDVTIEEFDAMFSTGQPVEIISSPPIEGMHFMVASSSHGGIVSTPILPTGSIFRVTSRHVGAKGTTVLQL
jgi:hypothetical protein